MRFQPANFGRVSDQSVNYIVFIGQEVFDQTTANESCASSDQGNHALILKQPAEAVNYLEKSLIKR